MQVDNVVVWMLFAVVVQCSQRLCFCTYVSVCLRHGRSHVNKRARRKHVYFVCQIVQLCVHNVLDTGLVARGVYNV